MVCNNCNTTFEGNYCPKCGQKENSGRIIFRESAREILEHYFDFDAPLFHTIKMMITSPGSLIRDYIHGKRKSYSHPVRYFILILAVYLLVVNILDFNPIKTYTEAMGAREIANTEAPVVKASDFFRTHINTFLIVFAFMLAFWGKLFNLKSGYHFVEYLALSFFVVAEYLFFSVFIVFLCLISPKFFLLNYFIVLLYPIYVFMSFRREKFFISLVRSICISLLSWISYVVISFTISYFIVNIFGL